MSNILLLGGTGAMGQHLVHLLKDNGYNVYVTSRNQRTSFDNVTYIQGNARDIEFLNTVLNMHPWDVVVDFMVYNSSEFASRVEKLLSSCGQYIFLSSSRVYADCQSKINESSPRLLDVCVDSQYIKTDEYALAKAREENILFSQNSKNWTIIRPYITYSECRLQLGVSEIGGWLYRALKGRTIVFSDDIAGHLTTLTYGYDVACGIASVIGKNEALNHVFHITTDKSITWKEVLDIYISAIEEKTGKKVNVLMIPENERLSSKKNTIIQWQVKYDRLFNRKFDNSNIKHFIDTSTFYEPEKGLRICVQKFIDSPQFNSINWKVEAYYDRLTHEHTSLSEINTIKQKIKYLFYRYLVPISYF